VIEVHLAPRQVDVTPLEARELVGAHALALEEAVRQPAQQRDVGAREELHVFVGVQALLRLAALGGGEPALRYRVRGAQAARVDGERKHAAHHLSDLLARAGGLRLGDVVCAARAPSSTAIEA